MRKRGKSWTIRQFKREGGSRVPQLDYNNRFNILASKIKVGASDLGGIEEKDEKKEVRKEQEREKKKVEVRKAEEEKLLREVTIKIGLERVDTQERITVEVLLDSSVIGLVIVVATTRHKVQ